MGLSGVMMLTLNSEGASSRIWGGEKGKRKGKGKEKGKGTNKYK